LHPETQRVGAQLEPEATTRSSASKAARRIVVADNDSDALDLALTDLRLEGHQVWGAPNARGAEALVASVSPDVVVLDYRMPPGEDGLTLAERLVALPSPPRVVIYSNYQSADLRARAAALGVPFLAKGNLRALRRAVAGS
jgi:CheY-like chemotaxis protein